MRNKLITFGNIRTYLKVKKQRIMKKEMFRIKV